MAYSRLGASLDSFDLHTRSAYISTCIRTSDASDDKHPEEEGVGGR